MNRTSWIFLLCAVGAVVLLWMIEERSNASQDKQLRNVGAMLRDSQVKSCDRVNELRNEFNTRGEMMAETVTNIRMVLISTLSEASSDPGNTGSRQRYSDLLGVLRSIETEPLAQSVEVPACEEVIPKPETVVAHLMSR